MSTGIDLLELPVPRFLAVVYFWATRHADEVGRRKFDARLYQPPPGVVPTVGPWTAEAEQSAFRALKAGLGMRDRVTAGQPTT